MQKVTCTELKIDAEAVSADTFEQLKQAFDALGGSEETETLTGKLTRIAWFEVSDNPEEQVLRLQTAAKVLGAAEGQFSIQFLNDDWETAWQKNWTAMPIGQTICVRPSFCEALPDRAIDVVLDPGMAFGTGTHPTTYLCLEAIERYCQAKPPKSVLDMGAGSGLLAIAAGKMGASDIHAIDYDPISVEASSVNAAMNNVSLTSTHDHKPPARTFELVVANILAGPLLDMSKSLAAATENHLILSGTLSTQVPGIIQAYEKAGLTHLQTITKEEWAVIEFIR